MLAEGGPTDAVAPNSRLTFDGPTRGDNVSDNLTAHAITKGVGPLTYEVGAGVTRTPATAHIVRELSVQRLLDLNDNGIKDPGELAGPPVLGALPSARVGCK